MPCANAELLPFHRLPPGGPRVLSSEPGICFAWLRAIYDRKIVDPKGQRIRLFSCSAECFVEMTHGGSKRIQLVDGSTRHHLLDGDRIVLRGFCQTEGNPFIDFGALSGQSSRHCASDCDGCFARFEPLSWIFKILYLWRGVGACHPFWPVFLKWSAQAVPPGWFSVPTYLQSFPDNPLAGSAGGERVCR
jgi:hypothetical protein